MMEQRAIASRDDFMVMKRWIRECRFEFNRDKDDPNNENADYCESVVGVTNGPDTHGPAVLGVTIVHLPEE